MERRVDPELAAWLDLSAGVAGDMLLAALVDAGADLEEVQSAVDAVIPDTVRLVAHEVQRAGMRALKVDVELLVADQHHRSWSVIRDLLTTASLDESTRRRAVAVFSALAEAEARVHGVGVGDVHFHEVGAWDSIADVVGVCAALTALGISAVTTSGIALGSGTVSAAHGRIPVPVPAVLELVRGWEVVAGGDGELATPTGVALATALSTGQGGLPVLRVTTSGVGAGTKDATGRPNVVRVVVGHGPADPESAGLEPTGPELAEMVLLEANVDDLDPRVWPTVIDTLMDAGAADAWLTPIVMKRGRPAQQLSVLTDARHRAALCDIVLTATSTIGIRETPVRRSALARGWCDVDVDGCRVGVKVAHRDGRVVTATPEFRDVEAAALSLGVPVRHVLDRSVAAAVGAGLVAGAAVPEGLRLQS
ncbi:nickel pincer cofactor biosynthesis protein LarC [Terrabacter terrigena]|uniref:Pyridinium-3,5-bisthiocarboxylic acid mononucleotide nickel insertion protein n=1 Tax=Terrabacter terrigena TaxID=574718 RepID=A0ABW3MUC0_9MICO